jgi:hypothetical protein
MVITRERSNNNIPVSPKTDSVSSTRSSSRGDGRSSTASSDSTANSSTASGDIAITPCRNSDWRSVKRSMKGLWKSMVGV